MKKIVLTVLAALLLVLNVNSSYAQLPSFFCGTDTYSPIIGTAGPAGDDATLNVVIPFAFTYIGVAYTQASICTNGWVALGTTTNATYVNDLCTITAGDLTKLCPFWEDLNTLNGGTITYTTSGIPPNRIFIVQYDNVAYYNGTGTVTFQVKLYETSNLIEFLYGPSVANSTASGSVGLNVLREVQVISEALRRAPTAGIQQPRQRRAITMFRM